jgi:hypothetical protein
MSDRYFAQIKRSTPFYTKTLEAFRKQFKDVAKMTRIYINEAGKVYAGEWVDSNGVINFNSGYAPDVAREREFID